MKMMIDAGSGVAAAVRARGSSAGRPRRKRPSPAVVAGRSGPRRRAPAPRTTTARGDADARGEARPREDVARGGAQKENVDRGALRPGARVLVLCEEGREWRATIKRSHEKHTGRQTGRRGFKIHYDGMKRSVEHWVPEDRVVASLDRAGKKRRLRPPREMRSPESAPPVRRPRPVSDASDIVERNARRPDAGESSRCNAIEVFVCVDRFCDDFDLFDGELLRSATRDDVLKDL